MFIKLLATNDVNCLYVGRWCLLLATFCQLIQQGSVFADTVITVERKSKAGEGGEGERGGGGGFRVRGRAGVEGGCRLDYRGVPA